MNKDSCKECHSTDMSVIRWIAGKTWRTCNACDLLQIVPYPAEVMAKFNLVKQ